MKGRLSTVDLLVLTSLGQLLYKMKILFIFLTKQDNLNEEVNTTLPSAQLVSLP